MTPNERAAEVVERMMRNYCAAYPRHREVSCPDCLEHEITEAIRAAESEALESGALGKALEVATAVAARWSMSGLGRGDEDLLNEMCAALRDLGRLTR